MDSLKLSFLILLVIVCSTNAITFNMERVFGMMFRKPISDGDGSHFRQNRFTKLEYIEQLVDNFNPKNKATFDMRYYRNDEFFTAGSPIFIYVGGEWTIDPVGVQIGRVPELAKEFHAQLYYTEHRYYGRSFPKRTSSTKNLKYLTIDQAMADLAKFIAHVKQETGKEQSPVIIIGGSYSGTLVTWFKQKYPKLVAGVWSSSSPLFAKPILEEYQEMVGAVIRSIGGEKCYQVTKRAFEQAEQLIRQRKYEEFKTELNICPEIDLTDEMNIQMNFLNLAAAWGGIVQYSVNETMKFFCERLTEYSFQAANTTSDLRAYGFWVREGSNACIDVSYEKEMKILQDETWIRDQPIGIKQWFYQICTGFGWFQSSESKYQPFGNGFPADIFYQYCLNVFGINRTAVDEATHRTNERFGGWSPNVENVLFTHGVWDPWRTVGLQRAQYKSSPLLVIDGASHGADLGPTVSWDSVELKAVKLKVADFIRMWINNTEPADLELKIYN